jgi:hypothetical protein
MNLVQLKFLATQIDSPAVEIRLLKQKRGYYIDFYIKVERMETAEFLKELIGLGTTSFYKLCFDQSETIAILDTVLPFLINKKEYCTLLFKFLECQSTIERHKLYSRMKKLESS